MRQVEEEQVLLAGQVASVRQLVAVALAGLQDVQAFCRIFP